jgi:DNA-binding Lrp family transcriptional regulator
VGTRKTLTTDAQIKVYSNIVPTPKLDQLLIEAIQNGLPLVSNPYAVIGERIGMSEVEVIARLSVLLQTGVIKRLGVVVYHRKLGFRANAMIVWDIADKRVNSVGQQIGKFDFVTLCYQRAQPDSTSPSTACMPISTSEERDCR